MDRRFLFGMKHSFSILLLLLLSPSVAGLRNRQTPLQYHIPTYERYLQSLSLMSRATVLSINNTAVSLLHRGKTPSGASPEKPSGQNTLKCVGNKGRQKRTLVKYLEVSSASGEVEPQRVEWNRDVKVLRQNVLTPQLGRIGCEF